MWEMSPVLSLLRAAVASRRLSTSTVNGEHRTLISLSFLFSVFICITYWFHPECLCQSLFHLLKNV